MFAVIETGSKQYKVREGQVVVIEKLDAEPNASVNFSQVLLVNDGNGVKVGAPYVDGIAVSGTVLEQFRDDKKLVFKFKRKTGYKRTKGHRQHLTAVRITSIGSGNGASPAKAKAVDTASDKAADASKAPKAKPATKKADTSASKSGKSAKNAG